ncbi:hypothetical protein TVAG_021520 [Trichomonas vaginalis G3]|uniref:I/LWEQ domain-containing protein n=1 Tax=Trichomonas vaginalis (strain ATCC PRA-98 / G3) TaxID=412133 RepID=A2DHD2_TRIV3|nr:I/LWEQ domain family [Trichomonas vaginalis G3]EAY20205.1 hypothetical protein TVAG_021520 [Trichomonas vaginalis G3]KAI5507700.1 I/LWEQ domain family [Trichomonas vaginalis G3]|eukprot:XP_001581191.1 hypothetical protein [Trichomonas vaginalis G3]
MNKAPFPAFASTISKYKVRKTEDLVADGKAYMRLNQLGYASTKIYFQIISIRPYMQDIITRLPYCAEGPQPQIPISYSKVFNLATALKQSIDYVDQFYPQSLKNGAHIKNIIDAITPVKKMMIDFGEAKAASMASNIDSATKTFTTSIGYVDQIIANCFKYESAIQAKLPPCPSSQQQLINNIASVLISYELFYVDICCLMSLPNVLKSKDAMSVIQNMIANVRAYADKIFQSCRLESTQFLLDTVSISTKFQVFCTILSQLQPIIGLCYEFSRTTISLITAIQTTNDLICKLEVKSLMDLMKNATAAYLNKKSFEQSIMIAKILLQMYQEKYIIGNNVYVNQSTLAAYQSLVKMLDNCSQTTELAAFTILSVCRFISAQYPDARLSEDLLIALSQKIAIITRQFHKEGRDLNQQLIDIIEAHLEIFPEKPLAEVNYFMTAIKKNSTYNIDSDGFVLLQQSIFDMIAGIPTSLMKLISLIDDTEVQSQMTAILKKFQPLSTRFGLWLHLYYTSVVTIVHNRAESVHDILNYSLSLLLGKSQEQDLQLVRVQALVNSIASILSNTPQNFTFDLLEVSKLIAQLQDISEGGNDFLKVVQGMIGHPYYQLLHVAAQSLVKIAAPLPAPAQCLPSLVNFEDKAVFTAALLSHISRSLLLAKNNEFNAANNDSTILFYFASSFTFMLMNDAMVATSGTNGAFLVQYSAPLRSSIDVFNTIATNICLQKNPPEAQHLPTYIQSIIKTNSDMYNLAISQPQPMIFYKMPQTIKDMKVAEEQAKSLPNAMLRNFAPDLVRAIAKGTNSDTKSAIQNWYDLAKKPDGDLDKGLNGFINTCVKIYNNGKSDMKNFVPAMNQLSVSLAMNENMFGRNIAPVMNSLHKQILEQGVQYMDDPNNMQKIMGMIATATQVRAFPELSKLKLKDVDQYTTADVRGIIKAFHKLRTKGKSASTDDLVSVLEALKNLEAFYALYPNPNPLMTKNFVDTIVAGSPKKDEIDSAIKYFADRLNVLVPLLYKSVDRIRDLDALIDLTYDKFDMFKEEIQKAIKTVVDKGTFENLYNALNNCMLCVADSCVLGNQSLVLRGIQESEATKELLDNYTQLQDQILSFGSDCVKNRKEKKGNEAKMTEAAKSMIKLFDNLLNVVEKPNYNERGPATNFIANQYKLYNAANKVACDLAYAVELSASSIVPAMFTDGCNDFQYRFGNDLPNATRNGQNLKQKAVGKTAEFTSSMETFEKSNNAACKALPGLKCGDSSYPIDAISDKLSTALVDMKKYIKNASDLTDQTTQAPDAQNAMKLPEDYILPAAPEKAPSLNKAWNDLQKANTSLVAEVAKFRKAIDVPKVTNEELVNAVLAFRKVADKFGDAGVGMTAATPDQRIRVATQAALYGWGSNVTNVQNAIRSRLLRVPGYDEELKDSCDSLISSMLRVMKLADEASRIVASNGDEGLDDVTRQLVATAREVDALMAQMSTIEDKVNTNALGGKNQDVMKINAPTEKDINNPDWLIAFVVSCAKIILKAASIIVTRSKEITSKTIAKQGKVDNEKGYIKSATEISESAKLLMFVADLLISGKDDEIEYKIIAAAKIINGAIASLVAVMGVKGSDLELKMQVKTVRDTTDKLIKVVDKYINMKLDEKDKHEPKKTTNPMILRLNMQQQVNAQRKLLEEEEKRLFQFRRSFGKV